ncbi:hypothetical protein NXG04_07720 [Klebsiella pneumoniae]|nr:hypothetical protein [Klebsiella pneumoniae]MDS7714442.1 hypothetical protein [Klebsiella pneumoniae]
MAKVFKATVYFADYNEEIQDEEDLKNFIEDRLGRWVGIHISETKESEDFEWEDDLKINKTNRTAEDFEEYLKD